MRVLALDHGSARCGVAVSDPTGTLATPLGAVERPDTKRGLAAVARLVEDRARSGSLSAFRSRSAARRASRRAGADVCRAPRAESLGTGGASRRAPDNATRGANRGRGRCGLARRRPPARELPRSHPGGRPRVSSGPPPVPGGRSPEEREAARREREARRAGKQAEPAADPPRVARRPPARRSRRDWLADARRLAQSEAGGGVIAAEGGGRGGGSRRRRAAVGGHGRAGAG